MSCPDCFTGTVHEGTPLGHVETIHGLPTYVAGTSETEPEGIIVIISDAFGWDLPNSKVLADAYAKRGNYTVYLPDFMDGNLMPLILRTQSSLMPATQVIAFLMTCSKTLIS